MIHSKTNTAMDTSMVILTLAFLVVFVAPFFVISAIKERREKREEAQKNEK